MSTQDIHNEQELLQCIAKGDEKAFTLFFHNYYSKLHAIAAQYVKNEFWADEIVQDVFTDVWTKKNDLPEIDNPAGWLHRLTRNKSIDRIRRAKSEIKAQYALQVISLHHENSVLIENREQLYTLLEQAIEQLPAQRKSVYKLRYQEGLSLDQVATRLQISRNTVRNYLVLALDDIRRYLLAHADLYAVFWVLLSFF